MSTLSHLLLHQCLAHGITNYVLCPGGRNAPLVLTLQRSTALELYYHPDERAAAFFALGRTMSFDEPCAVLTTSGTALAECLPAVIEAHYQGRPLVIISADRPPHFRHTGAPQTILQPGLMGSYAAFGADFSPECGAFEDWDKTSPLHLNLPLPEDFNPAEIQGFHPPYQSFAPLRANFDVSPLVTFLQRGLSGGLVVLVGGLRPRDREAVFHLLDTLKIPVVADPNSGIREILTDYLLIEGDRTLRENLPGKVLRLGEVPIGRFWRDLEEHPEIEVLSISPAPYSGLARPSTHLSGDLTRILGGAGPQEEIGDRLDHLVGEAGRRNRIDELLEAYPTSEPGLIRALSLDAATGESLYLGNSLPIREWSTFSQRQIPAPEVWANRGANGIDGQIATWLGATREVESAWAVLGDLTVLYDLNALGMSEQVELTGRRLVIINNAGGRIFGRLPRMKTFSSEEEEAFAQSHGIHFEPFAQLWGWDYLLVQTPEDLDGLAEFEGPVVVEVIPDPHETTAFWNAYEAI